MSRALAAGQAPAIGIPPRDGRRNPWVLVQRVPDVRLSAGTSWYIATEPASSMILLESQRGDEPAQASVTFRLRNTDAQGEERECSTWAAFGPGAEERPLVTITRRGTAPRLFRPRRTNYPVTFEHQFTEPGHYTVAIEGIPQRPAGPGLTLPGQPFRVTIDLDVIRDLRRRTVEAPERAATDAEDITRLEDPAASEGEIVQTFRRVAVRRGIDVVNRNKEEALGYLRLYTQGRPGRSAQEAAQEIQRVLDFDFTLVGALAELRANHYAGADRELRRRQAEQQRKLMLARESIVDAFPVVARVGHGPDWSSSQPEGWRAMMTGNSAQDMETLQRAMRQVIRDCDRTRNALVSEDLDILDVDSIVREVRQQLGIDSDERRRRAVDGAIRRHQRSRMATQIGLAGAALALLLVPGLGPYMAAAAGIAGAAVAWEHAEDLRAAAGAGVSEGIVPTQEAEAAAFWAAIETLTAGLDISVAARSLRTVAPHVPGAADRLIPRVARRAGTTPERLAARAAMTAAEEAEAPILMTADELTEFCQRQLRRPIASMRGRARFHDNWADYASQFRREFGREAQIPGGGYFNPNTGELHVSPRGNLLTALHEAVHLIADDTFPLGRQLLGDFLDEGITEAIVRQRLFGYPGRHGYDLHVRVVEALGAKIGRETVENAVLHGAWRYFRDAAKEALGGSEPRLREFLAQLRRIGSDASGRVTDEGALRQVQAMIREM